MLYSIMYHIKNQLSRAILIFLQKSFIRRKIELKTTSRLPGNSPTTVGWRCAKCRVELCSCTDGYGHQRTSTDDKPAGALRQAVSP